MMKSICHLSRYTNSRNKDIHVVKLKDADPNCTHSYGQKDTQFPNNFWQNSCKNQSKFSTVVRSWPTTEITLSTECGASPIMDLEFTMHSQNHFNKTKGYQMIS